MCCTPSYRPFTLEIVSMFLLVFSPVHRIGKCNSKHVLLIVDRVINVATVGGSRI
jgi:hypothetical protein